MIIANYIEKIKYAFQKAHVLLSKKETLISLIVITTGISGFLLGQASGSDSLKNQSRVIFTSVDRQAILAASASAQKSQQPGSVSVNLSQTKTTIFGSKSGTKYYNSWCKAGNRVKLENRIYFESSAKAEAAGRSLAASCK